MTGSICLDFIAASTQNNSFAAVQQRPYIDTRGPRVGPILTENRNNMDIRKEFPEYETIPRHLRNASDEFALHLGYRVGGVLLALNDAVARALQRSPRSAAATR
jgi:hypothetical protein